jgi:Tol biopolymer transport system component
LDSTGTVTRNVSLPPGHYIEVAVAPQGHRAAVVRAVSATESQILVVDLDRGGETAVTSRRGSFARLVWSSDGSRLLFTSDEGPADLYIKDVGDSAPERLFYRSSSPFKSAYGWSPDGKWVVIGQLNPVTLQDIYLLPASGQGPLQPYLIAPGRDWPNAVSPDSHWLLYTSENSGPWELAVQSFPVPGHHVHVAQGASVRAWWSPDQRHVYYIDYSLRTLMTVDVEPGDPPRFGVPHLSAKLPGGVVDIAAMPDRREWLALMTESGETGGITVVQNWQAGLPN